MSSLGDVVQLMRAIATEFTNEGEAEEISDEGKVVEDEARFPKTLPNDPSVSELLYHIRNLCILTLIHTVFPLSSV
jgi:hypothetical protein